MTHDEKQGWLLNNPDYAKSVLSQMRGVGKLAWKNFLWAFGLEEKVVLSVVSVDKNTETCKITETHNIAI
jgi:hypothetical protein